MKNNDNNAQMLKFNEGDFTNSEMNELFIKMIDDRINHQKIKYLKNWEQDHSYNKLSCVKNIAVLEQQKCEITSMIKSTKKKQTSIQFELVG